MKNKHTTDSMWPDFDFKGVITPLTILRGQANELSRKSKNVLEGEIIATEGFQEKTGEAAIVYQFYIKAPLLSNYRYLLFRMEQKIALYPVEIYFVPEKKKYRNIQENNFPKILEDILKHPRTVAIIQSLYTQSLEMTNENDSE